LTTKSKEAVRSAHKPKNIAEYISMQIDLCGKKQLEIAEEAGFDKPNMITMIKQGKTKLPIDKVPNMAKALGIDPLFLLRMAMMEYSPANWAVMESIMKQPALTENELDFIRLIRKAKVADPKIRNDRERAKLLALVNTLKGENEAAD